MTTPSDEERSFLDQAQHYLAQKEYGRAEASLRKVLALNGRNANALMGIALVKKEIGQFRSALEYVDAALELMPRRLDLASVKADILESDGRPKEALACLESALEIGPAPASLFNRLGILSGQLHQFERARNYLIRAVELKPDSRLFSSNLAGVLNWGGDHDGACARFWKSAELVLEQTPMPAENTAILLSRLVHDREQIDYLAENDLLSPDYLSYADNLRRVVEKFAHLREPGSNPTVRLSADEISGIAPSFNRFVHISDAPALKNCVVNGDLDIETIESGYLSGSPAIAVIDDILAPEALDSLYRYCLESTVFKKGIYTPGYVGSMIDEGFASPLLLQIGEEFRKRFPRIFADYQLYQAWAYKYDSQLSGIKLHADFAAVNVNFWISPDEGNLDDESGGLVIWDKGSPRDWDFEKYNRNHDRIQEFLADSNAQAIKVPFRRNRAVFFDSTLFHRTDDIMFRDRYEDRRINVTFLYGRGLDPGGFAE